MVVLVLIINPPQSAILGMHNIIERPIAVSGKVEIHPMMYVAYLTTIGLLKNLLVLVAIKEALESPMELLLDAKKAFEL
jgi:2-oxoglutarate dehydrogenase E2 component (dihydrolipoamide succinyltransferase)